MEARTPLKAAEFGAATHPRSDLGQLAALRILRSSPVCVETPLDRHCGLLTPNTSSICAMGGDSK
jgi:hypothetical protein